MLTISAIKRKMLVLKANLFLQISHVLKCIHAFHIQMFDLFGLWIMTFTIDGFFFFIRFIL